MLNALLLMASIAATGASSTAVKLNDNSIPLEERVRRAKALATDPRPAAIDELVAGLSVMNEELRDAIVKSLESKKAAGALLSRAADEKRSVESRVEALAGIRALKPKTAAAQLGALLDPAKVKSEAVREAAAHALCVVEAAAAEAALIKSLQSEPSAKVRYYVALALGEIKTPNAKSAVKAQLAIEKDFLVQDSLARSAKKHAAP